MEESNNSDELSTALLAKGEDEPLVQYELEQQEREEQTPAHETPANHEDSMNLGVGTAAATHSATSSRVGIHEQSSWERGEMQPSKFHDTPFAIVFLLQFLAIAIHGSIRLSSFMRNTIDSSSASQRFLSFPNSNNNTAIFTSSLSIAFFAIHAALLSKFFTTQARIGKLITFGIWMTIASSAASALSLFYQRKTFAGMAAVLYGGWAAWYYFSVRDRIPFAASNLNCGMGAVRQNSGVALVGVLLSLVASVWSLLCAMSCIDLAGVERVCSDASNADAHADAHCSIQITRPGWIIPYALSLFWTAEVSHYSIHTVAAGITASWYFTPEQAMGFWSVAVRGSVMRSFTTSFGSICLGALLVAVIQLLELLVKNLRNNRREREERRGGLEDLLLCCLDCILRLVEDIVQYFNKWVSFVSFRFISFRFAAAAASFWRLLHHRSF